MANILLQYIQTAPTVSKQYKVEGGLVLGERKIQPTPQLTVPKQVDANAVLNTLYGQKRELTLSFIILPRTDDYTNGTGSYADGSANAQRIFLMDSIFKPTGYHVLQDELGNQYVGRITALEVVKQGDEPVAYTASCQFAVGISPI